LSLAIQWYNNLQTAIEHSIESLIEKGEKLYLDVSKGATDDAVQLIRKEHLGWDVQDSVDAHPATSTELMQAVESNRCVRVLRLRCPACFGGEIQPKQVDARSP